ncbi:hypothetical protein B2J93_4830 [Marssonina coronariae]|uniref:Uncharacterized protein n=1 Tax=Diplocarpon coronariae TaxID=2795749 RepID=A0A218Z7C0_9HELO|nr:hypothetical protein B2J93_4830 [Marssonina coronariae]
MPGCNLASGGGVPRSSGTMGSSETVPYLTTRFAERHGYTCSYDYHASGTRAETATRSRDAESWRRGMGTWKYLRHLSNTSAETTVFLPACASHSAPVRCSFSFSGEESRIHQSSEMLSAPNTPIVMGTCRINHISTLLLLLLTAPAESAMDQAAGHHTPQSPQIADPRGHHNPALVPLPVDTFLPRPAYRSNVVLATRVSRGEKGSEGVATCHNSPGLGAREKTKLRLSGEAGDPAGTTGLVMRIRSMRLYPQSPLGASGPLMVWKCGRRRARGRRKPRR